MAPTLDISSAGSLLTADEAAAIIAARKEFQNSAAESASRSRRPVLDLTTFFEVFAAILATFYAVAIVAFSGALLFYTFCR